MMGNGELGLQKVRGNWSNHGYRGEARRGREFVTRYLCQTLFLVRSRFPDARGLQMIKGSYRNNLASIGVYIIAFGGAPIAGLMLPYLVKVFGANSLSEVLLVLVLLSLWIAICFLARDLWSDTIGINDSFIEKYNLFGKIKIRFYWSDIERAGHHVDDEGYVYVVARGKCGRSIYWGASISNFTQITDKFIASSGIDVYAEKLSPY